MTGLPLRILSGLIGLALVICSYIFGGASGLFLLSSAALLIAGYECGTLLFEKQKDFFFLLPLNAFSFLTFLFVPNIMVLFSFLILEVMVWTWVQRFQNKPSSELYKQNSQLYVFLFYSLIAPTFLLGHLNSDASTGVVFFLLTMVASFDTLSLFWGKLTGGKIFSAALYPQSSPSKTIEGALFAALTCTALTLVLDTYFPEHSIFYKIDSTALKAVLSMVIFFAALTGDLAESLLKRAKGAKDSGHLFPGHGGFFDRLDGFLFAGFISYIILQF